MRRAQLFQQQNNMDNPINQNPIPEPVAPMPSAPVMPAPAPMPTAPVESTMSTPPVMPASAPMSSGGGSKKIIYIILTIIIVLLIGAGVYYYLNATAVTQPTVSVYPTPTPTVATQSAQTEGTSPTITPIQNASDLNGALNQVDSSTNSSIQSDLNQNTQDSSSFSQ